VIFVMNAERVGNQAKSLVVRLAFACNYALVEQQRGAGNRQSGQGLASAECFLIPIRMILDTGRGLAMGCDHIW
jgi:hypothetical protein